MKKCSNCLLLIMILMLCMVSCGKREEITSKTSKSGKSASTATVAPSVEPTETPLPTQIPKGAKKTIEESLRGLLDTTPEELQAEYFKEGSIKYNKLSDWKDAKGKYHVPKGYTITYLPSAYDEMAAQQMPQELLDEISTEDLFQLIISLPGNWAVYSTETYLDMVSRYYLTYNFMTDFIRRKDSDKAVQKYYQKYSKADKSKYTKDWRAENYQKGYKDTKSELDKAERFQLTEGLEWFYRYKDGKKVPNENCLGLGCMGHY